MKIVSRNDMRKMLFNVRGSKPVTISTKTKPALIGGKKCPFIGVEKIAVVNVMINFDYTNSVNNQRKREGNSEEFVAAARKWGATLHTYNEVSGGTRNIPFVAKNVDSDVISEEDFMSLPDTDLFLNVKIEKNVGYEYILNGEIQNKDEVNKYIRPSTSSSKQDVEKEVIPRSYSWTNVTEIVMSGEVYKIAG